MDFQRDRGLVLASLNLAIEQSGVKREALAALAEMSVPQFSRVTNGSRDTKALHEVIDALPHDVFVRFMQTLGRARGLRVFERDSQELSDEFFEALQRMVTTARLLMVRRPAPAKAKLKADGEE